MHADQVGTATVLAPTVLARSHHAAAHAHAHAHAHALHGCTLRGRGHLNFWVTCTCTRTCTCTQAAVNLNLWITEDDANLDPSSGGLVVYHAQAPVAMAGALYNAGTAQGKAARHRMLAASAYRNTTVPYRANRMVRHP